jgi:hypothetical protein
MEEEGTNLSRLQGDHSDIGNWEAEFKLIEKLLKKKIGPIIESKQNPLQGDLPEGIHH